MNSCYAETEQSAHTFAQRNKTLAVDYITPAYGLDNLKIGGGDEYGVRAFRDVIHVRAHLKAMFLPNPFLCSEFLRLRDRSGTSA